MKARVSGATFAHHVAFCTALALGQAHASGQISPQAAEQYFSNGAQLMSVPASGQPGAEFFWSGAEPNGADRMSVPAAGQPGAEYFSNGADVMSMPGPGQPGAEFFSNGAAVMSVPAPGQPGAEYFSNGAAATSVPGPGQPGAEFFSNGAAVMSVPAPGQPGAEYFSNGATATSVPRAPWFAPPVAAPTTAEQAEEPPSVLIPAREPPLPANVEVDQNAGTPLQTQAPTPTPAAPSDVSPDMPLDLPPAHDAAALPREASVGSAAIRVDTPHPPPAAGFTAEVVGAGGGFTTLYKLAVMLVWCAVALTITLAIASALLVALALIGRKLFVAVRRDAHVPLHGRRRHAH
ncbi:MAG TPA: hypothetical protein VF331_16290 [Polyangiales bacterium]